MVPSEMKNINQKLKSRRGGRKSVVSEAPNQASGQRSCPVSSSLCLEGLLPGAPGRDGLHPPSSPNAYVLTRLYRGNDVRTVSLGWVLVQCDSCPYKRRECAHRHKQKEHIWKTAICKSRRETWARPFPRGAQGNQPCPHLDGGL